MFADIVNFFESHRDPQLNKIEVCQRTIIACEKTKVLIIAAAVALLSLTIFLTFTGPVGIAFGVLLGAVAFVTVHDSYNVINNFQQISDDILNLKQHPYLQTEEGIRNYAFSTNTLVARHFFEWLKNRPDPDPHAYQRIFGNH